ncbi:MAG: hypothetical protein QCI82_09235 [Candidatus Thermoplasmatota archaeon]|nr:hypothetical protein [Candidatus Thermoplasmatota archaeon]
MARFGGKGPNRFNKKKINPGERDRRPMLNLGKFEYFKYDLNEILSRSDIEDNLLGSFKASLIAKSSKMSIQDAKDYIIENKEKDAISSDTSDRLCRLLDRYTRYR